LPALTVPSLLERFEAHARSRPQRPAVSGPGGAISYGELDDRAARFAGALRARGVAAGDVVGLCLDWTPDLLAGLIGAWKAGAAYLPLDPALPAARLAAMLAAGGPAAVLVAGHWRSQLAGAPVSLVTPEELLAANEPPPHGWKPAPTQLAYLMFTSGSTGGPKGVMVSHGNIAALFDPFRERFDLGSHDAWSLYHSYAFGYSVWEIWGALSTGARLVPVPAAARAEPVSLQSLLAGERVTVLSQTPSAFRQTLLHEAFDLSACPALRLVALSGEAVPPPDVRRWFARRPAAGPELMNTYAVTETAGQVTCRVYAPGADAGADAASVGTPLPGVELRLLNADGRDVAPGETGELCVGGPGVALGYLGDPQLTAERFVRLSSGDRGPRFYRTGDRARFAADGAVVFTGRADRQFKWRGYRVEAADVEAALQSHPAVRAAAVDVRGAGDAGRLVAWYVTGQTPEAGSAAEFWPAVGPYQVYDEFLYDLMSTHAPRLDQFRKAFAQAAPGCTVLDIGTGEHALLARLCVEAGARHVYAVEILPEAAARARATVARLGLAERITVIEGDITQLDLPAPVALATQGIIGNIGSADGIIPIWNAARASFAPNCIPVPVRCRTLIAPAELPETLARQPAFSSLAQRYAEQVYSLCGGPFDIRLCVRNFSADGLLAPPGIFEDLDFRGALEPSATGSAQFHLARAGRLDGFLLWTEVDTGAGAPLDYLANQQAWLPVFFPLPEGGVELAAGAAVAASWERSASSPCPDYRLDVQLGSAQHTYISRYRETAVGDTALHRQLHRARAAADPGPEALRAWLAERLPAYMLPTAWLRLPALPLNVNGKLDRPALPDPGRARPALAAPPLAPRDALEDQLARIWADALQLDAVGVEDNFFDLGGDSIAAVRLVSRVQRQFDAPIGLAALFDAPTVAALAVELRRHGPRLGEGKRAVEEGVL
jgi:amino acid adenylation domain-containing protein